MSLSEIHDQNLEEKHRTLLKRLSPVDSTLNHELASSLQQEGTGKWFLRSEAFKTWLEKDNDFLWLRGIRACPKPHE